MTETSLRNSLGIGIILGHFSIILLVLVLWAMGGYAFAEMTTAVGLITPLFVAYTTGIIKFLIQNRKAGQDPGDTLSTPYVFLSILVPVVFVGCIATIVLLKAFNVAFSSFEEFKITLAVIQSVFGLYVAQLLSSLFELRRPAPRRPVTRTAARST